jgi:serine/threonine-protein kinase HipA
MINSGLGTSMSVDMSNGGHENMVLVDRDTIDTIISRLESLEKRSGSTSGSASGPEMNLLKQQFETVKQAVVQTKGATTTVAKESKDLKIQVDALVKLASEVLTHRADLQGHFRDAEKAKTLRDILSVGTSAGGARAKAVIAWNSQTNEVRSGQIPAGEGFDHWLLKFDGVAGNKDKEDEDPKGYGMIEFAYYLMAKAAGLTMSECRLLEENGRRHFMTRRFDRLAGGAKLHMQSLCALAHFDFNQAGAYAYEQALLTIRQLKLPMAAVEEQFRRMVFNIVARNQDDHVKNIAFLMNQQGEWSLAPAFDVTYSYNPSGSWTATHQMTLNGKRDGFTMEDFEACAKAAVMKRGRAATIIAEVVAAVARWPDFAKEAQLADDWRDKIRKTHRLIFS